LVELERHNRHPRAEKGALSYATQLLSTSQPIRAPRWRQRDAITAFANRAGFVIADEFYDPAMSGADPIETRSGPL
jgi:hypothetical protein